MKNNMQISVCINNAKQPENEDSNTLLKYTPNTHLM